ncbi:thioredoxin [Candidatus Altiarchaeota archaeon]
MMDELEALRQKRVRQIKEAMMMSEPIELTDDTFGKALTDNNVILVDCWAPWCGPCKMIAPVIGELAADYAGKIAFGKLNVDVNQQVAAKYGIMSIPTLLIFKDGELVDRITGAQPKQAISARLDQLL